MKWSTTVPSVKDLNGHSEEYYWVRGGLFNRSLVVRVNSGVNSSVIDGKRSYKAETNFSFFADNYPDCIWMSDLNKWPGLNNLEWCGPVPRPQG